MFTGLVEAIGTVHRVDFSLPTGVLKIVLPSDFEVKYGDSIAVNGCCLTVAALDGDVALFHLNGETLSRTNLDSLRSRGFVNLERAMVAGSRLDGHMVAGHVDGTGRLTDLKKADSGWILTVNVPLSLGKYLILKGSISLDGVSLTINSVADNTDGCSITAMIIPTTIAKTHFSELTVGWEFNIEVDIVGKYLERLTNFSHLHK